jgi:hypothetical protein
VKSIRIAKFQSFKNVSFHMDNMLRDRLRRTQALVAPKRSVGPIDGPAMRQVDVALGSIHGDRLIDYPLDAKATFWAAS